MSRDLDQPPGPRPGHGRTLGSAAARIRWDRAVSAVAMVLLGANQPLAAGATTATAIVVALLPVWFPTVRRSPGLALLLLLVMVAAPAGLVLAWQVGPPAGRAWDLGIAVAAVLLLLTATGAIGLVVWSRTLLGTRATALLLGAGLLLDGLQTVPGSTNPWKYAISLPLTVLLLAAVGRTSRILAPALLAGLAVVGILNESRSYAAFCILTAALLVWQGGLGRRGSRTKILVVLGAAGLAAYQLGTELLVEGYLGQVLQERSVEQVRNAGSLIAGGRPEWAATAALFRADPSGVGLGAVPSSLDLRTAKEGLAGVGIDGDNGYVNNYMFGGGFKLHSIVADLWVTFGIVGIVLGAVLVGLVVRALATAVGGSGPEPVVVFLCLMSLWWLAFGPSHSNLPDLGVALGLASPLLPSVARGRPA